MQEFIIEYLERLDLKSYKAVGIVGSYAIGQETKWSDIDLFFITDEEKASKIEIFNNRYFVSNYYTESILKTYLKKPPLIMNGLKAFGQMEIIVDVDGILSNFKKQIETFKMTSVLKEHCQYSAKVEFVGFIEEAAKGVQGLKEQHVGKMLNALYGLSYGMFSVIRLRDQIMLATDNDLYQAVYDHLDDKDPVKELGQHVFNIIPGTLEDQIDAGLEIFMHVSNSLMDFFSDEEKEYVMKLVHDIIQVI